MVLRVPLSLTHGGQQLLLWRDFQIGANGGVGMPGVTAIRALRMQKDQPRVGHTIHPSDSGRQASERPPCCHKESAQERACNRI